jgi:uncharacterized protein involved in copper resistance
MSSLSSGRSEPTCRRRSHGNTALDRTRMAHLAHIPTAIMDLTTTAIHMDHIRMDHIRMDFTRMDHIRMDHIRMDRGPSCSAEMVNAISRKSWDFEADQPALEEFRTVR